MKPRFQRTTFAAITAAVLQGCTPTPGPAALDTAVSILVGVDPDLIPSVTDAPMRAEQDLTARRLSEFWNVGMSAASANDSEPNDLWERIRQGFELPGTNHRQALKYARWYAGRPQHLETVTGRAEAYLYLVVEEVEKRGMPTEIALLPVVESAYHPFAYSPAHAAGLWQFIPSTASLYGLKRTSRYDGRRDILASTRAALDYLQKLRADFNGDWLLALAAYNCGEGCVQHAIEANRKKGKRTDFWSLKLPAQAKAYVPSLLGISAVVKDPERFSAVLRPIPNDPYLAEVDAGGPVKLAEVAKICGIPLEDVHRLNAGYHRGVTDSSGSHRLLLPIDRAEIFMQRLARLNPTSAPAERAAIADRLPRTGSPADGPRVKHTFQVADVTLTTASGSMGSTAPAERPDTQRRSGSDSPPSGSPPSDSPMH